MTTYNYGTMHPAKQLLYLILVAAGCTILGVLISLMVVAGIYGTGMVGHVLQISSMPDHDELNAFRIFLALGNTIGGFFAPAIFFAYLIVREPALYLKASSRPQWIFLILAIIVFCIMQGASPFMEFIGNLNQQLQLPAGLSGLQKWMRDAEDSSQRLEAVLLNMPSVADLLINLLIVGFLPALSEEFLFRGCMQTIFKQWTKNTHWAIWITAFIFSFIHFEFFGFLPRFLLGAVLGYFVAWSGNIWLSVWAHFINNGTAVVIMYLFQHKLSSLNPDNNHLFNTTVYLFSTLITVILLVVYKKLADAKLQLPDDYD